MANDNNAPIPLLRPNTVFVPYLWAKIPPGNCVNKCNVKNDPSTEFCSYSFQSNLLSLKKSNTALQHVANYDYGVKSTF